METSDIMCALWNWPRLNDLHLTSIYLDNLDNNNIPQKGHLTCKEGAHLTVTIKLFSFKDHYNLGDQGALLLSYYKSKCHHSKSPQTYQCKTQTLDPKAS